MGRSRAVPHLSDEDFSLSRFKKKRTTSTTENSGQTFTGQGPSEKKHALYKCNYCNKDISGKIRIKCVICPDFDLCVECFSVGAEVTPHKSNHPYRVMDNLSLPLLCSDWSADEEILLLEGIEMYGLGNWTEVSGHVGTKNKTQCISHYNIIYMNSPCFPLPDLSHVMGKSKGELLAMSKEHDEVKKGPEPGETTPREEPASCWATRAEELRKECPADRSSGIDAGFAMDSGNGNASINAVKKASIMTKESRDSYEVEGGRCVGEKKPRTSGDEGPSVTELNGYNFKRQEFEIEYDNDAEQLLADMEFRDTDTNGERELKLQVLHIYNKRLDERKRRKEFILERNLLFPVTSEKRLAPEEREICRRYKVFMRFQSKEEHEELLKSVIEEHFILKRIQDLQEARAGGCRTSDEARRYIEKKRKEERDGNVAHRAKEGVQDGEGAKISLNPKPEIAILESSDSSPSTARDLFSSIDVWDISGFPGEELLSESEKRLCNEIRMLPAHYLKIMQKLSVEVLSGNITEKSDASSHLANFNVNPAKLDRIYDMLVEKGIPDT